MNRTTILASILAVAGCGELEAPRDVLGNFEVQYLDNLRIFIGGEPVAEVAAGEDAEITWDGESFQVSQVCGDDGVECPGETYWRTVGVDQPWGDGNKLLNFVNLDPDRGELGQRMGGLMQQDGTFEMLSGLALDSIGVCTAVGVGNVVGTFTAANDEIVDGTIVYKWGGGCQIAGVEIGTTLRIETDYRAVRVSDLDLSGISAAPPIDESGETL